MNILTVDSLDGARKKLLDCFGAVEMQVERVSILGSVGRILARDVFAGENVPPFRRSTVDGYAVCADDTIAANEALPVFLSLEDAVLMGKSAGQIKSGRCAYVPTGGMLPAGADAAVMVEYSEMLGHDSVALYKAVSSGENVVQAGEDVKDGELLVKKGAKIRPQEIGALAALGITEVTVFAPLKMTVISTGDELIAPEFTPKDGEIRDINTYALRALAEQNGYAVVAAHVLPDDKALIEEAVINALPKSDVIVISGGSSQGKADLTKDVITAVASPGVLTHGISIKPGKPTLIGWDSSEKTLIIGLPGHPVAAVMVFEVLLSFLSNTLTHQSPPVAVWARISVNLPGSPGKTTFQPVILSQDDNGYAAAPIFGKSGLMTTLTKAGGYIMIDMNKEGLKKGETVLVNLF